MNFCSALLSEIQRLVGRGKIMIHLKTCIVVTSV